MLCSHTHAYIYANTHDTRTHVLAHTHSWTKQQGSINAAVCFLFLSSFSFPFLFPSFFRPPGTPAALGAGVRPPGAGADTAWGKKCLTEHSGQ